MKKVHDCRLVIMLVYSSGQEKIQSSVSLQPLLLHEALGRAERAATRHKEVVGLPENSYFNVV